MNKQKVFLFIAIFFFQFTLSNSQIVNFDVLKEIDDSSSVNYRSDLLDLDVLFIGGYHHIQANNGSSIAKQDHDFTGYVGIDGRSDSGYVIVNHEHFVSDPILGDGGGMTVFTAFRDPTTNKWSVVDAPEGRYRNVDFSHVGGTISNCGGFQTTYGTVLTAEEKFFYNNREIYRNGSGIRDTSDFVVEVFNGDTVNQSIKRYQNFDWIVEVDVANAKAIKKRYNMGRASREGGVILPDNKTVFLTDDLAAGFIFKFVAEKENDFSRGQLYAYQEGVSGVGGKWLALPMTLDAMINARDIAASLGATMFVRTEWMIYYDNKVYISETGVEDSKSDMKDFALKGARFSKHIAALDANDALGQDSLINDYFGRILTIDVETNQLEVFLEGGGDQKQHMAQPDCLSFTEIGDKPYMLIHEDLNGLSHGRVPPGMNKELNEIYWLDLTIDKPKISDLKRFVVGPKGCETTGGVFTPDGTTYFFNVQHPNGENTFPFNNSVTVAISGYVDEQRIDVNSLEEELHITSEVIDIEEIPFTQEEEVKEVVTESDPYSGITRMTKSDLVALTGNVLKVVNKNGLRIFKCKMKKVSRKVDYLLHGKYFYSIDGGEKVPFVYVRS